MGLVLIGDSGSLYLVALPISVTHMEVPDPPIAFTSREKEAGKEKGACPL